MEAEVLVGPCGFKGECSCGKCRKMTSQERLNLMLRGIRDMCDSMDVFVAGGGLSTSFRDIVPAVVVAVVGKLVVPEPLTKPAKKVGDKIIISAKPAAMATIRFTELGWQRRCGRQKPFLLKRG